MITRQNLHTHCTYCDGKDSPRELVDAAINAGLTSLGFSSHAYTGIATDDSAIEKKDIKLYLNEISRLKEEYRDKIRLYAGFERDGMENAESKEIYSRIKIDYEIGSVHYIYYKGKYFCIDYSMEQQQEALQYFDTEKDYVLRFYEEVVRYAYTSDYDIVGHYDLITKFSEKGGLCCSNESWYKNIALEALDAVAATGKLFEINTGAISRGYRTVPYPEFFLLQRLKELGVHIVLTSDCHNKNFLTYGFDETEAMLKAIGFNELFELTDRGFTPYRI